MFFSADDDDQDFMSPGGSKLANIFGMDKASGGNESLTYTAPKQPKKKEAPPEGSAPAVAVACVVTTYKYVDNNYASQGKLGAALLANSATKDYRILLYVNKQQHVLNAKITANFSFNVQQNNYATFYDDARQAWSVMFDTTENAVKFAKEVALAKANCAGGAMTDLVQQDLVQGEGGALEQGDSVEVKYIGWLFNSGTLGKVFDQSQGENLFRFKVGKGKVIKGWDQGMLGMKKGGRRFLVIPPGMGYGAQGVPDRIPANATLVFDVQVIRVKLQKGESSSEPTAQAATLAPPSASVPSSGPEDDDTDDTTIKGRTKSINEQLSHAGGGGKSKLISRMAKMGQPMLPFQGAVVAQPSDSEEDGGEHPHPQPPSPKPALPTKPRSGSSVSSVSSQSVAAPAVATPVAAPATAVPVTGPQPGVVMVGGQPMTVDPVTGLLQPQAPQQPAFLQNLPGAQQLAVYQNPNMLAQQQQQQQAALLQQQLQQQQQQQQLLQQQLLGQLPGQATPFLAPNPLGANTLTQPQSSTSQPSETLLSESRQQNTAVRISLSKVSDKVDRILDKLEQQTSQQAMLGGAVSPYGGGLPAPTMEANVLMHNITRIVQENERLKKEVYDQSSKVHELNDKMSILLEKNQKYVEQSQTALEQRNEGYKHTASQSQAKVLALEQEKVQLATDLSSASSQISTLQLELAEIRRREGELRQKLQDTTTTSSSTKEEVDRLTAQREEDEQKISSLSQSVREQKQAKKSLEAKLANCTEEMADLKSTAETLEKNLSDRKRKAAEERRKMEEEMEDAKISYEQTIEGLRERLRKQKKSVDAETESKMSQIEEDIARDWQAKCDKMVAAAASKHAREMEEAKEEKEALVAKLDQLEKKLESVRSSGSSTEQQISELQDELADMKVWKDKYENLRTQASAMKEKYEERIETLEQEKEEAEEGETSRVTQLQGQVQTLREQLQQTPAGSTGPAADVATEVKKIMNSVFQSLRGEFEADESYAGSEALALILKVIKETTLKLVSKPEQNQEEDEEEDEDDDDEEEQEEEDDEKNEEEEDKKDEEKEDKVPVESVQPPKPEVTVTKPSEPESREEAMLADSRSSSGAGSDFEMVTESGIEQEISGRGEGSTYGVKEEENAAEQPSEIDGDDKDSNSGNVTPVREVAEGETKTDVSNIEGQTKTETSKKVQEETDASSSPADRKDDSSATQVEQKVEESRDTVAKVKEAEQTMPAAQTPTVDSSPVVPPVEDAAATKTEKAKEKIGTSAADDSREPPPLFDDDEDDDDQDSPLFGKDDTVSDTFGVDFTSKPRTASSASGNQPAKKVDLLNDEDSKPQPPPPLFGDDSDDDDLDWLS